jgi:IS1 family transposase
MKLTGFFLFFFVFLSNESTFAGQPTTFSSTVFLEQNSGMNTTEAESEEMQRVFWTVMRPYRRNRPYRNPLRRKRKELQQLRRHQRCSLKKLKIQALSASDIDVSEEPLRAEQKDGSSVDKAPVGSKKRGRPSLIATNHLFCPNPKCQGFHILGPDLNHNIVGGGSYPTTSGENRQMYQCKLCGKRFSETHGTVFFGLKTPSETIYRALASLAEGQSIRATARIFGVDKNTVLSWLRRAGEHCQQVSSYLMRNLKVAQVQLDELWTFVTKKEKNLSAWEKLHSEYGDTWIWTAVDPVHKLVLTFHVGEHEEKDADTFLHKLKTVLAKGCLPLLTSDQLPHYTGAILKVFGRLVQPKRNGYRGRFPNPVWEPAEDLEYATVRKERQGGRIVSVVTKVVFGLVEAVLTRLKSMGMKINTSFVERMNLTLRHMVSRLRRKGLTFSKDRQYLERHLHLSVAYYHFVRPHRSLRCKLAESIPTKGDGSPKVWEEKTPGMSAGLTDHIWSMKELLSFRVPEVHMTSI